MTCRPTTSDMNDAIEYQEHLDDNEVEYAYEMTEDDLEPTTSSSYGGDSSYNGSPQVLSYHYQPSINSCSSSSSSYSPVSQQSMQLQSANTTYSYEDDKILGSLEERFPFLKEERKRTRKLLTPEQTRVLEAILEKTVYPSTPLREAVARQLGIPSRKVQIWFQNKRQGRRRTPTSESLYSPQSSGGNRPHHHHHHHLVGQRTRSRSGTTTMASHLLDQAYDQQHLQSQFATSRDGPMQKSLSSAPYSLSLHHQQNRDRIPPPVSYLLQASREARRQMNATAARPRAHSDLSSLSAIPTPGERQLGMHHPVLASSIRLRTLTCQEGVYDREQEGIVDRSPDLSSPLQSFTKRFESATNLQSPPIHLLPSPPLRQQSASKQNSHATLAPSLLPSWTPTSYHRSRPPPLSFAKHNRMVSNDSIGGYGDGKEDSNCTSSPLQDASSTLLSLASKKDLQLAPMRTCDFASVESTRSEALPRISELIRH